MPRKQFRPPRLAEWVLGYLVNETTGYTAMGDFEEEFHDRLEQSGYLTAVFIYWMKIPLLLPFFIVESVNWSIYMVHNYSKITVRTLIKHPVFSTINIIGLAVSMTISLLSLLIIIDQLNFDKFHEDTSRIFRITSDVVTEYDRNEVYPFATSPGMIGETLSKEVPGIAKVVKICKNSGMAASDNVRLNMSGLFTGKEFFEVFGFSLISGSAETALNNPYTMIISAEKAYTFFGDSNPVGETLRLDLNAFGISPNNPSQKRYGLFTVTGVAAPQKRKSHIQFDYIASFATVESPEVQKTHEAKLDDWESYYYFYNYLLLNEETKPEQIEPAFSAIIDRYYPEEDRERYHFELEALENINLGRTHYNEIGNRSSRETVFALIILTVFVMALAGFNYVSLSIARSMKRAREIGLRKVIGAQKLQIIRQFLTEGIIISLVSLIIASLLIALVLPLYNSFEPIQQSYSQFMFSKSDIITIIIVYLLFAVAVGVTAGLYPALYFSSFQPAEVLKGEKVVKGFSRIFLRKSLLVIQFVVTLIVMVGSVTMYRQVSFMMEADYGLKTENVLTVDLADIPYETFKQQAQSVPGISMFSGISNLPLTNSFGMTLFNMSGSDEKIRTYIYYTDENLAELLGLDLLAGRLLSPQFALDKDEAIVINEQAVQRFGFLTPEEAVGKLVNATNDKVNRIIGVVQDFHFKSLEHNIEPVAFRLNPEYCNNAVLEIMSGSEEDIRKRLGELWDSFDTIYPLKVDNYGIMLNNAFEYIDNVIAVLGALTFFVMLIAGMGLLGMAVYSMETRVREVSIRKVLGAGMPALTFMLSRDSLLLVAVSVAGAVPVAWFLCDLGLRTFVQRVETSPWVYLLSIATILAVTGITVGTLSYRTATTNPVNSLRRD